MDNNLLDSFDKVWEKIDGENKLYVEVLKALDEEISQREQLGAELHKSQDFTTLTKVERERDAFVQVRYGVQGLGFLGEPEKLKERGLDESSIWKEARAKGIEMKGREKIETQDIKKGDWGEFHFKAANGKTQSIAGEIGFVNKAKGEFKLIAGDFVLDLQAEKGDFQKTERPVKKISQEKTQEKAKKKTQEKEISRGGR